MNKRLEFKKIQYNNIFCKEFKNLKINNKIEFKKNIAVLYGPNGTGKTSLSKVLAANNKDKDMSFQVKFYGNKEIKDSEIFHVISDQNSRNIIRGTAKDYLIGDDIAKEDRLIKELEEDFNLLCDSVRKKLKDIFNITTKSNKLIDSISDKEVQKFVKEFANKQFKGNQINKKEYVNLISRLGIIESNCINNDIGIFIKENYKDTKSIIYKIMNINISDIKQNIKVKEIEENNEAIKIINKFLYKEECIVCDNKNYDKEKLLKSKENNKINIENQLDEKTKSILNEIVKCLKEKVRDPLNIENIFIEAIKSGNTDNIVKLQKKIQIYLNNIGHEISNIVKSSLDKEVIDRYNEYEKLMKTQLQISEEDLLYLKEVIGNNMGKVIDICRDKNNKIKITLSGDEFLERDRDELGLSTGQQNFISLSFELLKAKKSNKSYIVLDDPISSFDSIYKNKIVFCIAKFLEGRQQIILTHNTELIKLLQFQAQGSFELYLFNNTEGSENGFINVNDTEKELLLKVNKLLDLLRGELVKKNSEKINIWDYVKKGKDKIESQENQKRFLISLIPFMRGYSNIVGNKKIYKDLCKVMHGYEDEYVNIGEVYNDLFCIETKVKEINNIKVNVTEILKINLDDKEILDSNRYPLLNKSLYHTLNYLFLRLTVEHRLCTIEDNKILKLIKKKKDEEKEKYSGETTQNIIDYAFPREDESKIKSRIFFTSRKTLLNEFNHFEGNMNIFQPAIDITDESLEDEKMSILEELNKLVNEYDVYGEVAMTLERIEK